jgi:hypothetical protein
MKKILILSIFSFVAFFATAQTNVVGGAGVVKVNGDPNLNTALALQDQRYEASQAWDTVANVMYVYKASNAAGSKWEVLASGDASTTNEGLLGVTAGGANTAVLQGYNSAGTATGNGVTVTGTAGIAVTETTSTNGGSITLTATDPSVTNETITAATVTGGNLRITEAGTNYDVPVTSIAPVQSVAQGTGITVTNAAGVYTVNATDASVTNEIQTISATAPSANSTTIANSLSGGSFTLSTTAPLSLTGAANAPVIGLAAPTAYDNHVAAGTGGVAIGGMFIASTTNTMGMTPGTAVFRQF